MSGPRLPIKETDTKDLKHDDSTWLFELKAMVESCDEKKDWKKEVAAGLDTFIKIEAADKVSHQFSSFFTSFFKADAELKSLFESSKLTKEYLNKLTKFKAEYAEDFYQLAIVKFHDYESMVSGFESSLPRLNEFKSRFEALQQEFEVLAKNEKKIILVIEAYKIAMRDFDSALSGPRNNTELALLLGLTVVNKSYLNTIALLSKFVEKDCISEYKKYLAMHIQHINLAIEVVSSNISEFELVKTIRQGAFEEAAKQRTAQTPQSPKVITAAPSSRVPVAAQEHTKQPTTPAKSITAPAVRAPLSIQERMQQYKAKLQHDDSQNLPKAEDEIQPAAVQPQSAKSGVANLGKFGDSHKKAKDKVKLSKKEKKEQEASSKSKAYFQ